MSEQQFRGALASGGTFTATGRGIEIFGPAGNSLAHFGSEVIAGVSRNGQVVTIERQADTIVTLTAASITDAAGLEQFVRDTIVAPPAAADEGPLAFDAFDSEPEQTELEPPPRPQIISRPEEPVDEPVDDEPLPPPTPTMAQPPPPEPPYSRLDSEPEPIAPLPPVPPPSAPPPPSYATRPQEANLPPSRPFETRPIEAQPVAADGERGGRRWLLWGCLGCGGLLVLLLICTGVLIATDSVDLEALDDDDNTPTPFIIVATSEPTATQLSAVIDEATPTEEEAETGAPTAGEATPTEAAAESTPTEAAGEATATEAEDGSEPTQAEEPAGDMLAAGESAVVNGIEATYQSARFDDTGLIPPDAGRRYLVLSFQMVNTTSEPVVVSSLLQFELRDEADEVYSVELFAELAMSLDAEIAAGETLDGEIAFDVPEGSGPFTVTYADIFADQSATWDVGDIEGQ